MKYNLNKDTVWYGIYNKDIREFVAPYWFLSKTDATHFMHRYFDTIRYKMLKDLDIDWAQMDCDVNDYINDTGLYDIINRIEDQCVIGGGRYELVSDEMKATGYILIYKLTENNEKYYLKDMKGPNAYEI